MGQEGGTGRDGRREKRGREAGFPRWKENGKLRNIAQYFVIFCNRNSTKRGGGLK